jgi:hypothetical protein
VQKDARIQSKEHKRVLILINVFFLGFDEPRNHRRQLNTFLYPLLSILMMNIDFLIDLGSEFCTGTFSIRKELDIFLDRKLLKTFCYVARDGKTGLSDLISIAKVFEISQVMIDF